jgi:hypothetical protein
MGGFANNAPIVTDGLVFYVDAGNSKSYPGSGTTWSDLVGSNNGTLVNGPTYNSANGGSIVFDGVNDGARSTNTTEHQVTVGTIQAWVKSSSPGSAYRGIIVKQEQWGLFFYNGELVTYDWGNVAQRATGQNIDDGNWHFIAMTFTETVGTPSNNAIIYLDGSSVLTTTVKNKSSSTSGIVFGAGRFDLATQQLNGNIACGSLYNRALSAAEVTQNYNALKNRFV